MCEKFLLDIFYNSWQGIWKKTLWVSWGSTAHQALKQANFLNDHPQLSYEILKIGIFGKKCLLSQVLKPGDRLEVYHDLPLHPRELRRLKARLT
jgi:putative ubiquitin-RnfH superfamily antitoxin RatB of RatAB toxin-antitoxin module